MKFKDGEIKIIKKSELIKEDDKKSFRKALITIIIADLTISFDNVIAVAGAAKSNYTLLIFGLNSIGHFNDHSSKCNFYLFKKA